MKIKIPALKPRNRLVPLSLARKAGAHRDRKKFDRSKQALNARAVDAEEVQVLREAGLL